MKHIEGKGGNKEDYDEFDPGAVDVSMVDEHASYLGPVSFNGRPDIQLHRSGKVRHLVDFGNVFIFVVWSSEQLLLIMAMSNMHHRVSRSHVWYCPNIFATYFMQGCVV